jgi:hypothetical protein
MNFSSSAGVARKRICHGNVLVLSLVRTEQGALKFKSSRRYILAQYRFNVIPRLMFPPTRADEVVPQWLHRNFSVSKSVSVGTKRTEPCRLWQIQLNSFLGTGCKCWRCRGREKEKEKDIHKTDRVSTSMLDIINFRSAQCAVSTIATKRYSLNHPEPLFVRAHLDLPPPMRRKKEWALANPNPQTLWHR